MSSFANEVILITGAASGLGREMTRQLIAAGATVAGVDRNPEAIQQLEKELDGKRFAGAVADVTDRANLIDVVHELEQQLGPIDRLIANAGVGRATGAHQFSAADFADIIAVNLLGVANSVEAVLPGMIERKRGHLVALSSLASYRGLPLMSAYCASKTGVNALFDSLAIELRQFNIAVTTVCPGWIRTPMTEQIKFTIKRMMEPAEAVTRILAVVEQRRRFVAFPFRTALLLRVLRWLPSGIGDRVITQMLREAEPASGELPIQTA